MNKDTSNFGLLLLIGIVVVVIWNLPFLGPIRYPFILLGTWFHEMGHGLTAIALGGKFDHLQIFSNGSGLAMTSVSDSYMPYGLARALTAAGGLMGPAIFGSILIIGGRNPRLARITLWVISIFMAVSLIIWARSLGPGLIVGGICVVLLLISFNASDKWKQITVWFMGIICLLSTWMDLDYMFSKEAIVNGQAHLSDTGSIANHLGGPYWMWGAIIAVFSFLLLFFAFSKAVK